MGSQRPLPFRISFLTEDDPVDMKSVSAILERVRTGPHWAGGYISPADAQFPLLNIEWKNGFGFVIQCYEDEASLSDFLLASPVCGPPAVEVELGGQALERWPRELFVSEGPAQQALGHFLSTGQPRHPSH